MVPEFTNSSSAAWLPAFNITAMNSTIWKCIVNKKKGATTSMHIIFLHIGEEHLLTSNGGSI